MKTRTIQTRLSSQGYVGMHLICLVSTDGHRYLSHILSFLSALSTFPFPLSCAPPLVILCAATNLLQPYLCLRQISSYIVPSSRCLLDLHTLCFPLDVDYHINLHICCPITLWNVPGYLTITVRAGETVAHSAHRQPHCSTGQVSWARPNPSSGP